MKHFATALLGFGIMLAALPTARAADTTCANSLISNTTINGNLVVPVYCTLENVTVTGNVQVQTNAQLYIVGDSTIDGNLDVGTGAILQVVDSGLTVDGNIEANQCESLITNYGVSYSSRVIVGGNVHTQSCGQVWFQSSYTPGNQTEIGGNFTCSNSQICVLIGFNVNGGVQFTNNSTTNGPFSFSDVINNTIGGNLQCQGNGNISGSGNTVGGHKTGQCANF